MRFKQYLIENKTPSFKEVITFIYDNCKPFYTDLLKNFKGFMYSGRNTQKDVFVGKVRSDREPKDSDPEIHKMLDDSLKRKFGWNGRSNAIFCTGSERQASNYGYSYLIFPINRYKFIYHPYIEDFIDVIDEEGLDGIVDELEENENFEDKMLDDAREEYYHEYEKPGSNGSFWYDGIQIFEYLEDENDVEDYVISHLDEFGLSDEDDYSSYNVEWYPNLSWEEFIDEYRVEWMNGNQDVIKDMAYDKAQEKIDEYVKNCKSTNIGNAIKSKHEIMVNCKKYYAVDEHLYTNFLIRWVYDMEKRQPTEKNLKEFYLRNKSFIDSSNYGYKLFKEYME